MTWCGKLCYEMESWKEWKQRQNMKEKFIRHLEDQEKQVEFFSFMYNYHKKVTVGLLSLKVEIPKTKHLWNFYIGQ